MPAGQTAKSHRGDGSYAYGGPDSGITSWGGGPQHLTQPLKVDSVVTEIAGIMVFPDGDRSQQLSLPRLARQLVRFTASVL